jgi:hypothetical protein
MKNKSDKDILFERMGKVDSTFKKKINLKEENSDKYIWLDQIAPIAGKIPQEYEKFKKIKEDQLSQLVSQLRNAIKENKIDINDAVEKMIKLYKRVGEFEDDNIDFYRKYYKELLNDPHFDKY